MVSELVIGQEALHAPLLTCIVCFRFPFIRVFTRVYLISRSTSPGEGIMWGMCFENMRKAFGI